MDVEKPLAEKTIKVTVNSTVPGVKLKSSTLKLNKWLLDNGTPLYTDRVTVSAETYTTLSNGSNYTLLNLEHDPEQWSNEDIRVQFYQDTCTITAELLNKDLAAKKYTVSLYPTFRNDITGQEVTLSTPVKLTLNVYSKKPVISLSAKGKLNTMDPNSSITYVINKVSDVSDFIQNVQLIGEGNELFDIGPGYYGDKQAVILTVKPGAPVITNKTYKLQLVFTTMWYTESGSSTVDTINNISFKVSQSALKFAKVPTLNVYQASDRPVTCTVELTSPAGATLNENSISVSTKSAVQFRRALGTSPIGINLADDRRSAQVSFEIQNPGHLVYGKSYTVYLDIVPENNASNVKPTQLKLTVKVFK